MRIRHTQTGLATLTTVLMLIAGVSALSLTLARTTHTEQRMANKQAEFTRVRFAAEAGLEFAITELQRNPPRWLTVSPDREVAVPAATPPPMRTASGDRFGLNIRYERHPQRPKYLRIHVDTQATLAPDITGMVQQAVRPFTVLTETAEQAPPLILTGCLSQTHGPADLYPRNADRHNAGIAVWTASSLTCLHTTGLDLHRGTLAVLATAQPDLWPALLAVSRARFRQLADDHRNRLPEARRRYWRARPGDLRHGRWHRSLGTPDAPVVLVFPAGLGCPAFQTGVRIHGFVFIDADCGAAAAWDGLRIYGSLAVNGNLNRLSGFTRLAHIEQASGHPSELRLPIYEVARIPGSWRDF
ncbi:MAG TPA: pilus assembly PilX N-terminal domain-containing protein [Thiohalobacter sp.]|nr:pilus assembly PilX N-terminal domain-containing protein [Thiohalobacter sp.]